MQEAMHLASSLLNIDSSDLNDILMFKNECQQTNRKKKKHNKRNNVLRNGVSDLETHFSKIENVDKIDYYNNRSFDFDAFGSKTIEFFSVLSEIMFE